jgi:poly(ribitol-phosphate) beta-N-acetylglucosaminyltransferase
MENARTHHSNRLSCRYLDGGLVFHGDTLQACCVRHHEDRGHTVLLDSWTDDVLPVKAILDARNHLLEQLQRPEGYGSCNGCTLLKTSPPAKRRYAFDYLNIAHYFRCNLHCSYCTVHHRGLMNSVKDRDLLPVLKAMLHDGFLDPSGHVDWAGGEPTLNPEFPEMSAFLDKTGLTQAVHTNAVVFSEAVLKLIPSSLQRMYVSVDAGTRETYLRVKGLDAFDRVWENLARYVRVGGRCIIAKMILLHENLSEVAEFVRHAEKAGIQTVIADLDQLDSELSDDQVEAGAVMLEECARRGIRMVTGWNTLHTRPEKEFTSRVHRRYQERLRTRKLADRVLQRIGTATALRHAVRIPRSLLLQYE